MFWVFRSRSSPSEALCESENATTRTSSEQIYAADDYIKCWRYTNRKFCCRNEEEKKNCLYCTLADDCSTHSRIAAKFRWMLVYAQCRWWRPSLYHGHSRMPHTPYTVYNQEEAARGDRQRRNVGEKTAIALSRRFRTTAARYIHTLLYIACVCHSAFVDDFVFLFALPTQPPNVTTITFTVFRSKTLQQSRQ